MTRRRYSFVVPILLLVVSAVSILAGTKINGQVPPSYGVSQKPDIIEELLRRIESMYVDSPNYEKLQEAAITAMLKELDPHSVYIPARQVKASQEDLQGNFDGIGIEFNILNDTIMVVAPISGGPSEELGIRAGDKIIKIDDKIVAGVNFSNEDVFKTLRGKKGTKVKVTIKRTTQKELVDFNIVRAKIPIFSVDASYMGAKDIGYIKINRFSATTTKEFSEALAKLQSKGMKDLILDLRGNPGGYLNEAFKLCDEFLKDGEMVVYTKGRKTSMESYQATRRGSFEKGRLVVLVDEGSASASEIVSGAVQDWDRGVIIGRRTFGKGLVQEGFALSDGSEVRLTVARYYIPSDRSIQKPYDKGKDEYYDDFANRVKHGELYNKDSALKALDPKEYYTKRLKRVVRGGGGIMPDVFIPVDTLENSTYLNALYNKGMFGEFAYKYMDANRSKLKAKFPTFEAFHKNFDDESALLREFLDYAEKVGKIKKSEADLAKSKSLITMQLKALIARQLYNGDAYFEVLNERNHAYLEAIRVLQDGEYEKMKLTK